MKEVAEKHLTYHLFVRILLFVKPKIANLRIKCDQLNKQIVCFEITTNTTNENRFHSQAWTMLRWVYNADSMFSKQCRWCFAHLLNLAATQRLEVKSFWFIYALTKLYWRFKMRENIVKSLYQISIIDWRCRYCYRLKFSDNCEIIVIGVHSGSR